jgi:GNAT superfamily N-acetyltransferase
LNTTSAVIRPAWNADLAAMKQVDPSLNEAERSRAATRALSLGRSWVADVGGFTVAYALTSFTFFGKPILERVAVAEVYRRRGVALALVNQCEASHQDDRMFVTVPSSNAAMTRLLAKAGFVGSGVIYNLDEGDPELVFVKLRSPQMTFVPFKREA